jgi:hypothetical protein
MSLHKQTTAPTLPYQYIKNLVRFFNFKLEEEGNTALLLLLPALFAENCFFNSALDMRCRLVVATPQGLFY